MYQGAGSDVEAQEDAIGLLSSVGGVLRLVGTGAEGSILMALGPGPLRTHQLTDRLDHLSRRSVYRHLANLQIHGLVARHEERGVPSRVVLSLTVPLGRNLFHLLRSFSSTHPATLRQGADGAESWSWLGLLGEFWELGLFDDLSRRPTSVIDLSRKAHPMTYHQVNRRASLFAASGLIRSCSSNGNGAGKHYELTDRGRRCMALVGGVGRWRQRHLEKDGAPGLTAEEMATVLRTALPLVRLPEFAGACVDFEVSNGAAGGGRGDPQVLQGEIDPEGRMRCGMPSSAAADGLAAATINTWFGTLLDGSRGRVKVRGHQPLVDACLTQLHDALWAGEASGFPAPTEAAAEIPRPLGVEAAAKG